MTIKEIPYIGYALAFMGHRDPYTDICAHEAENSGMILAAQSDEGSYDGVVCVSASDGMQRVTCALTKPEKRGQGIFTELMTHIRNNAAGIVRVAIQSDNGSRDIAVKALGKLGFTRGEDLTVYSYRPAEDTAWQSYMESRGRKICAMIRRFGYEAVSFAEAGDDILEQLYNADRSSFGSPFETRPFFDNPAKKLSREMSFAAVKNGELAAYTLGSLQSPHKGVLEQIAAGVKFRNTGIILLPFTETVEAFRTAGGTFAAYAIYGSNTPANTLRDSLVSIGSAKITENYYYIPATDRKKDLLFSTRIKRRKDNHNGKQDT